MPKKDGTMTKAEAQKEVQKILKQAKGLLDDAAKIMDEYGFTAQFLGVDYIPNGLEYPDDDDDRRYDEPPLGFYFEEGKEAYERWAGEWMPSSHWRGC